MNELMHVMQKKKIDACNAIMIFGVHGRSFQSFSLIKSWVQNQVSTEGKKFKAQLVAKDYSQREEENTLDMLTKPVLTDKFKS